MRSEEQHPSPGVLTREMLVCCFRHGESAANIGQATDSPSTIPLTAKGWEQAKAIARSLTASPDLIVMSPFQRAQDTAAPTRTRFPGVPAETWSIQEFTYLAPVRCAGTSAAQRRAWVDAYWAANDPAHVDGLGSESFADFIARVVAAKSRLEALHEAGARRVLLFGHGQFIQALKLVVQASASDRAGLPSMGVFRELDTRSPIENGAPWHSRFDGSRWLAA